MCQPLLPSVDCHSKQCHKTFPTPYRLKRHEACHSDMNPLSDDCKSDTQIKIENVDEHEKGLILTTLFKCKICSQTFTTKHQRDYHKVKEHSTDSYECKICGEKFIKRHQLKYHHVKSHSGGSFDCTKCEAKFDTRHKLDYHRKIKHGSDNPARQKQYKCNECDKSFPTQYRLKRHTSLHTGVKPVCCDHCGEGFYTQSKLKQHVNVVHLKLATTTCDICKKSFTDLDGLALHKKRVHTEGKSRF